MECGFLIRYLTPRSPFLLQMRLLFIFLTSTLITVGETEQSDPASENPKVEQLDANRYRIGEVIIDKKSREIRFPAVINLREGLLEYLIVHTNGKIHESLFATDISPTDLNVAFKLLRYEASKELYRIPSEPGISSANFYEEDDKVKAASRISITAEYEKDGETKSIPVHEWVRHETTASAMEPTPWIYGGGEFYENQFIPEQTGDIAAIFITNNALINYSGEDNFNDDVWTGPHRTRARRRHKSHPHLRSHTRNHETSHSRHPIPRAHPPTPGTGRLHLHQRGNPPSHRPRKFMARETAEGRRPLG